ncbi:Hypothetical predicted protein [Cloeon dipterum]|uniref:Uncharacterized protein n=1 Tax=Cloeon dipterum TaxID=197152 RepID=A0A8S1DE47_9INSE|nr:Hypothetical predicted protein [Cloeon dipterum]
MSAPPLEERAEVSSEQSNPLVELLQQYLNLVWSLCCQFLGLKQPSQPQQPVGVQPPEPDLLLQQLTEWFTPDEFQLKLFKGFCLVLFFNFLFICLAWSYYGPTISDKLMRPATSKSILELKKSVSQLKLPTEHTPRI